MLARSARIAVVVGLLASCRAPRAPVRAPDVASAPAPLCDGASGSLPRLDVAVLGADATSVYVRTSAGTEARPKSGGAAIPIPAADLGGSPVFSGGIAYGITTGGTGVLETNVLTGVQTTISLATPAHRVIRLAPDPDGGVFVATRCPTTCDAIADTIERIAPGSDASQQVASAVEGGAIDGLAVGSDLVAWTETAGGAVHLEHLTPSTGTVTSLLDLSGESLTSPDSLAATGTSVAISTYDMFAWQLQLVSALDGSVRPYDSGVVYPDAQGADWVAADPGGDVYWTTPAFEDFVGAPTMDCHHSSALRHATPTMPASYADGDAVDGPIVLDGDHAFYTTGAAGGCCCGNNVPCPCAGTPAAPAPACYTR